MLFRSEVLQKWRPELEEAYSCFAKTLHQPVLAKAFLKDEIRDAEKDARSIMCFQLLMWMLFVKSMNGLQLYFLSGKSDSLCGYAGVSPAYWLKKLNNFSREKRTSSVDFCKIDSRFNNVFVMWFFYEFPFEINKSLATMRT